MPLYFMFFLAMLAFASLLYVVAVGYVSIKRRPLPIFIRGDRAEQLHLATLALLWVEAGMAWLLYCNVYRIHVDMSALGNEALHAFNRGYTRRLPIVVLPYGLACLVSIILLWSEPLRLSRRVTWAIATLCIISVLSTPVAAGALGDMQEQGFSDGAYQRLMVSHLVRTVALTIAAVLALSRGRDQSTA